MPFNSCNLLLLITSFFILLLAERETIYSILLLLAISISNDPPFNSIKLIALC